jgi:hypothetical protein
MINLNVFDLFSKELMFESIVKKLNEKKNQSKNINQVQ